MARPSKSEIKAAIDKLKTKESTTQPPLPPSAALSDKKPNKNRIRKQGV